VLLIGDSHQDGEYARMAGTMFEFATCMTLYHTIARLWDLP
jgi:hypothetical protein